MKILILSLAVLTTSGCNPIPNRAKLTCRNAEFSIVLKENGDIVYWFNEGQSYRIIRGSIELSNGNGSVVITKVSK